jgi:hypothetical protein
MMLEAVTVGRTHIIPPRSPLFHGFWYLSSLTSGFCGEFLANPMIPKIEGDTPVFSSPAADADPDSSNPSRIILP